MPTFRHYNDNDNSFGGTRSQNLRRRRQQLSRKRGAPRKSNARSKRSKPFRSGRQTRSVGIKRMAVDRGLDKRRTTSKLRRQFGVRGLRTGRMLKQGGENNGLTTIVKFEDDPSTKAMWDKYSDKDDEEHEDDEDNEDDDEEEDDGGAYADDDDNSDDGDDDDDGGDDEDKDDHVIMCEMSTALQMEACTLFRRHMIGSVLNL
eukprot:3029186-Rhodomonas_salina.1